MRRRRQLPPSNVWIMAVMERQEILRVRSRTRPMMTGVLK